VLSNFESDIGLHACSWCAERVSSTKLLYNKTLVRYIFRRGIIYATQLAFIFVMIMSENFLFKFAKENFGKINLGPSIDYALALVNEYA
jgi:hypothetical protein